MKDYSRKSSELFDSIMSSQMDIDQKNNIYSIIEKELQDKMTSLN